MSPYRFQDAASVRLVKNVNALPAHCLASILSTTKSRQRFHEARVARQANAATAARTARTPATKSIQVSHALADAAPVKKASALAATSRW